MILLRRTPLIASLFLCTLSAFAQQPPTLPQATPPSVAALKQMAVLPANEIDIAKAALQVARGVNPAIDIDRYLAKLGGLADEMKQQLASRTDPEAQLRVMAAVIYQDWGFGRNDVVAPDVFVGFNEVLDQQQWNCLGLTILYVALGERVGIPLRMVAGTGHVLVEFDGEPKLYIETTDQGRIHRNKDYLLTYLPFPCLNVDEYETLDRKQTVAVLLTQTALAVQRQGRVPLARDYFRYALRFDPHQAEAYSGLGFLDAQSQRVDEAILSFRRSIEANPRFREAYGGLGAALYAKGDLAGATQAYRKALDLCPDESKAVFNLAQLLYEQGSLDEAIALYRRYTTLAPTDPDGFARLAFPLEDKGDLDGALAAYRKALELDPTYADAHVNTGLILQKQGNIEAARLAFEAALRLQPNSAPGLAGLARVSSAQGHAQEAMTAIEKASQLEPSNASVWLDYATIVLASGDLDRAIQLYRRAIQLDPSDPEPFIALAEVYLKQGDTANARTAAQRAAELGANLSPELKKLLPPVQLQSN